MVRFLSVILIIFAFGCQQEEVGRSLVVQGVLVDGRMISNIRVDLVSENVLRPATGAEVIVINSVGETVILEETSPGVYGDVINAFEISAGQEYRIEVRYDDLFASAETRVPVATTLEQVSATSIPIDSGSTGQPIFTVLWDNPDDLTHVLVLEVDEESPLEIPFSVSAGHFADSYAVPVTGNGVTLFDTDFTYYGEHTLEIYTIDNDYDALYFYQPGDAGNIITGGPENIDGGAGYITGACVQQVNLDLLQ